MDSLYLIENMGGYDVVKNAVKNYRDSGDRVSMGNIESALLDYRRANNIFERHDIVVFKKLPFERLFSVRHVGGDSIVIHEIWDEAGARSFSEDKPYSDIRHATEEEIKAGHRL